MKKQFNPTIKAHLIRGAFYLLMLLAVCAIPFAVAQRNATKRSVSKQSAAAKAQKTVPLSTGAVRGTLPASPRIPATDRSHRSTATSTGLAAQKSAVQARVALGPPTTSSGPTGVPPLRILPMPKLPQVILYDQYNNAGANATSSQDFEAANNAFDNELADDFVVPGGQTWSVESVDADGVYFNGPGPAVNFNVRFYSDSGGLPGALVDTRLGQSYVQGGSTFSITLSPAVNLSSGTYWVSVQSRMDFSPFGQWGWTDRTVQSNNGAAWQNPGGGFGVCPTWGRRGDPAGCNIDPGVPDQVFRLNGTIGGGGTPSPTPTCSPGEAVVNGGFETGTFQPWVLDGHVNDPVVSMDQVHSGTFSALAGGNPQAGHVCVEASDEPLGDSSFYQEFVVPAGGGTLSFWYWTCTFDSITFDWQDAYITDTSGAILQTIFHQCSDNQAWVQQTADMAPYAGQTVRIKFLVHQDGFNPPGDNTAMYVDDVSLPAGACGSPTPTASPTCTPGGNFQVLVAFADIAGPPNQLIGQIQAEPGVTAVDQFDAFSGTAD